MQYNSVQNSRNIPKSSSKNPLELIWSKKQLSLRKHLTGVTWREMWFYGGNDHYVRHRTFFYLRIGSYLGVPAIAVIAEKQYVFLKKIAKPLVVHTKAGFVGPFIDPNMNGDWWVLPTWTFFTDYNTILSDRYVKKEDTFAAITGIELDQLIIE
jgi:hypothetical protein